MAEAQAPCQKPSGRGAKGCLVGERAAIDSATHEVLRYRSIQFDFGPDAGIRYYYGLADMEGRQILPPNYMTLEIINKNWAYGEVQMKGKYLVDLRTGAQTPWEYGLDEIDFNGAKLTFANKAVRAQGELRVDMHLLGLDGKSAAFYPSVLWRERIGPFLVLNTVDEAQMTATSRPPALALWLDQSGQVVRKGPETFGIKYRGDALLSVSEARPPLRIPLTPDLPFTYKVYNASGEALLPAGVTGVAPIQNPFKLDESFAWDGWAVVRETGGVREVRVGRGSLEHLLDNPDTMLRVDDAAILMETVQNANLDGLRKRLVVHEAGKGWALYASLGFKDEDKRFTSPQEAANMFSNAANALRDSQVAARLAQEQAAAAVEATRREAGVKAFEAAMSQRNTMSPSAFRSSLQAAAFQAGGVYLSRFFAMYPDAAETPGLRDAACRDSALACDTAMSSHNATQAAYQEKQRQLFEQRVALSAKWNAMSNPNPDVRVNIYENGQFRTQVMPKSHYDSLYK